MKKFKLKYCLFAILSGFLLAVSFPKINAFYFVWVAFIPILYSSLRNGVKLSLVYGFICGFTCNVVSLYWLFPFLRYNTNTIQALICSVLLWTYLSAFFSIWTGLISLVKRHFVPTLLILFTASSWVFLEFVRTYLFTGFGWNLLGYSQISFPYIIQISDITGVYGVSFVIISVNSLMYYWLKDTKRKIYLLIAVCIVVCLSVYGYIKINKYSNPYGEKISVGIVQPNIDQYKKWNKSYVNEILNIIKQNTVKFKDKNIDLLVYPETVLPGYLEYEQNIKDFVKEISDCSKLSLIGGASFNNKNIYNSVFAIKNDGSILDKHYKNHLVIFGEFIPFRDILSKYFDILNSLGDFSKGIYMNTFNYDKLFIGSTICSENFFPNLSRKLVLNGAKILTNHTNDAWFFDSFAPYQHFVMNIFRAIENRKNVIVCANTGLSAIIDCAGNVYKLTNINENISVISDAYQNSNVTVYTKIGNIFSYICIIFVIFTVAIVFII